MLVKGNLVCRDSAFMMYSNSALFITFSLFEGFICIIGSILNGIICLTFCKKPSLLTSQNIFVFSIIFSDLLMSSVAVPISWVANILHRWPFGSTVCQIHAFLVLQLGLVTITNLTAVNLEKYLTVSKSMVNSSFLSKRQTLLVIIALWMYSFVFSVSPLVGLSRYDREGLDVSCSIVWDTRSAKEHVYFGFLFFGCFIVPVCLILFCNLRLLLIMRQLRLQMFNFSGHIERAARWHYRKEKKAIIRFFIMFLAFLVAFGPYAVVSTIAITRGSSAIHPGVVSSTSVFAKTSCVCNSFIFIFCYKRLRKEVVQSLRFCKNSNIVYPFHEIPY